MLLLLFRSASTPSIIGTLATTTANSTLAANGVSAPPRTATLGITTANSTLAAVGSQASMGRIRGGGRLRSPQSDATVRSVDS